jgi:MobA/MobL family
MPAHYRLQHGLIGRAKQRPGTAAAHLRYILRPSAATWSLIHVPLGVSPDREGVSAWMHAEERNERKNGHLLDKVIVALPRELLDERRHRLMERFVERVTHLRIPVIAAIHDGIMTSDEFNPHGHLAFRDRDFVTGKRYLNTTARGVGATAETVGSTQWLRAVWEQCVNEAYDEAGHYLRVDRRSAVERGVATRTRPFVPRGTWNRLVKTPAA